MGKAHTICDLTNRYLAGLLSAKAAALLKVRVRTDPAARREFARLLVARAAAKDSERLRARTQKRRVKNSCGQRAEAIERPLAKSVKVALAKTT